MMERVDPSQNVFHFSGRVTTPGSLVYFCDAPTHICNATIAAQTLQTDMRLGGDTIELID